MTRFSLVIFVFGSAIVVSCGLIPLIAPEAAPMTPKVKKDPDLPHRESTPGPVPASGSEVTSLCARISESLAKADDNHHIFDALLPSLVEADPKAAALLAGSFERGSTRVEMLRVVALTWASFDPDEAEKWAAGLQDAGERTEALSTVCAGIASRDPARALAVVERLGLGERRSAMVRNFVAQWMEQEPIAATNWMMARPADEEREQLIARAAFVRSQTDPRVAATMVAEQIPPGVLQEEAAISIVHQWAWSDWDSAAAWVDHFPSGPLQKRAEGELARIKAWRQAK
jgi:hypothetical protein